MIRYCFYIVLDSSPCGLINKGDIVRCEDVLSYNDEHYTLTVLGKSDKYDAIITCFRGAIMEDFNKKL